MLETKMENDEQSDSEEVQSEESEQRQNGTFSGLIIISLLVTAGLAVCFLHSQHFSNSEDPSDSQLQSLVDQGQLAVRERAGAVAGIGPEFVDRANDVAISGQFQEHLLKSRSSRLLHLP